MHGFHIALIGVGSRWDAHVLAVAEGLGKVPLELPAVVGLPDQIAERNAIAMQMLLDAGGENGAGGSAALLGESPEEQTAANIASGVRNRWQVQPLRLQPVARDIVEILGIRADLLEQRPGSFDVREVLFALLFAAAFFQQTVLAPDALERAMADGQIELADQAARAEGGQRFAKRDKLCFGGRGSFLRLVLASTRKGEQAGRAVLLEASQPLVDGGRRGSEESRGGLDAPLFGALDEPQTMVVGVFHLTHQIEIASGCGHGAMILAAARRPALPPAGRPSPTASSHSNTSTQPGEYDVSRLFHLFHVLVPQFQDAVK
jgi:hypothetical protein